MCNAAWFVLCITEVEEACEVGVAWAVVVLDLVLAQAVVLAQEVDSVLVVALEQAVDLVEVAEDSAVEALDLDTLGLVGMKVDMVMMTSVLALEVDSDQAAVDLALVAVLVLEVVLVLAVALVLEVALVQVVLEVAVEDEEAWG